MQAPTPPEPLYADLCTLTRPLTLPPIAVESLSTLPPPLISVDSRDHGLCRRSPFNHCRIHSPDPVTELLSTSPQLSDRVLSTSPHRSCELERRCRSPQPAITGDAADRCRILAADPVAELLLTSPRSSPKVLSTSPILRWHPLTNRRRHFADCVLRDERLLMSSVALLCDAAHDSYAHEVGHAVARHVLSRHAKQLRSSFDAVAQPSS